MTVTGEQFWVYENWRAHGHVAKIHQASCAFCKNGEGLFGKGDTAHGRWLGPLASREDAEAKALATKAGVRFCHFCA